jgi:hypothetical protein
MKNYYRIMLGRKSAYANECFAGGFIGADFGNMGTCNNKAGSEIGVPEIRDGLSSDTVRRWAVVVILVTGSSL